MRKNRKSGLRKERIIMLAASAFILTALTMTGIYVNQRNTQDNDQNRIDLNELNEEIQNQTNDIADQIAGLQPQNPVNPSDDLDVEINYEEANTSEIVLPVEDRAMLGQGEEEAANDWLNIPEDEILQSEIASNTARETVENRTSAPEVTLHFSESDDLAWPIVGNILMNYSMNQVVYYKTLNQYRYNPSVVIEATVGEPITAAADGKILSIRENVETGGTIICDLGDGYQLTYGQLENYAVSEGDYVEKGDILGYVAEPSIFYSEEGCNVYFKMTKDGEPVNPLNIMQ
ncbi:MAG: M23 family metallopeptidase [Lachnospiraceae bacterium]|nr:M23 family metallopeptidase [Lachnospiraceae bacterium]